MWSLGCVIAELFLGWPLYPGSSEYDQIRWALSLAEAHHHRLTLVFEGLSFKRKDYLRLRCSKKLQNCIVSSRKWRFVRRSIRRTFNTWGKQFRVFQADMSGPVQPTYYRMKTVEEYEASGVHVKSKETRKYIFTFLDDISRVRFLK